MYGRRSKIKIIIMIVSLVSISATAFIFLKRADAFSTIQQRFVTDNVNINDNEEKYRVVVVAQRIEQGIVIDSSMITMEEVPLVYLPSNSVTSIQSIEGKPAKFTIEKNTVLTYSMVLDQKDQFNQDDRLSDCRIDGGLVSGIVKEGDYIDIEYVKENGDRFIVLSKKRVIRIIDNTTIIIQTNDEERTRYEAVLSEIREEKGTLKTRLYLDENQEASPVTYVKSKSKEKSSPPPTNQVDMEHLSEEERN
ncbi:UNVERIFIED_CONTAM: Flp pilus assembly protein CpaB [Acetivibrio alkalicellulosi]